MIAKYKKNILVRRLITILAVVVSALLQTYVIQAFIRPANLLSSGFTGVAILIDRIASLYGHNISTSLGMLVLNIPVAILCSRSISMRFTFYSMLQVFLASFFLKICSFQPPQAARTSGPCMFPIRQEGPYGNMYLQATA